MTMWNEDLKGLIWRHSRGGLGVLYRPVVYVPGSLGPVKNSKISGDGIIRCHLFHWFPILWYLAHHFRVVQEIIIITYSPIKYSTPSLVSQWMWPSSQPWPPHPLHFCHIISSPNIELGDFTFDVPSIKSFCLPFVYSGVPWQHVNIGQAWNDSWPVPAAHLGRAHPTPLSLSGLR